VYEKVVEGTVKVARAVVQGRGFSVTEVEEEREWWRRRPLASVAREPRTSLSFCCRLALLLGPAQLLLMGLQKEVAAGQTSSCSSTITIDLTERIKTSRCARRAYFSPHHRSFIHSFSPSFPPSSCCLPPLDVSKFCCKSRKDISHPGADISALNPERNSDHLGSDLSFESRKSNSHLH
jgi:hypothetical protein